VLERRGPLGGVRHRLSPSISGSVLATGARTEGARWQQAAIDAGDQDTRDKCPLRDAISKEETKRGRRSLEAIDRRIERWRICTGLR